MEHVGKSAGVFNPEKLEWVNVSLHQDAVAGPAGGGGEAVHRGARAMPCPGDDAWLAEMVEDHAGARQDAGRDGRSGCFYLTRRHHARCRRRRRSIPARRRGGRCGVLRDGLAELRASTRLRSKRCSRSHERRLDRRSASSRSRCAWLSPAAPSSPGIYEVIAVLGTSALSASRLDAALHERSPESPRDCARARLHEQDKRTAR